MKAMKKVIYNSFFTLEIPSPNSSKDLLNLPSFNILETLNNLKILTNLPSKPMAELKKKGRIDNKSIIPKKERLYDFLCLKENQLLIRYSKENIEIEKISK